MKATGMVRRIDNLGRVVIPKEIRRTMKIRENDALEIFIDDEQVIFKKYSAVFELESIAQQLAEILYVQQNVPVIVCDMDKVVAVAGIPKNEVINRPVSHSFCEHIKTGKPYSCTNESERGLHPIDSDKRYAIVSAPIASDGIVSGAIMFLSKDEHSTQTATEADIKLVQAFASCLAKQLPA